MSNDPELFVSMLFYTFACHSIFHNIRKFIKLGNCFYLYANANRRDFSKYFLNWGKQTYKYLIEYESAKQSLKNT